MEKLRNVVSLFNGMSCGNLAMNKAGINFDTYYASEVDKYANTVTEVNYPNTVILGDVTAVDYSKLENVDLLIGGSPCQDLSSSNVWTEQKGLKGKKSSLFWEYVRAYKELKKKNPNLMFLLENVGSAKKEDVAIINRELGVEGVKFNSRLCIPQNRNRVYWTNIDFDLPTEPMTQTMQDLLETDVDPKYYITPKMYDCIMSPGTKGWQSGKMEIDLKIARPLTATMHKIKYSLEERMLLTSKMPLGRTGLIAPRVVYGTSYLGNLYKALSYKEKLALMARWFECTDTPVVIDSAGKYGAGLALEVIGLGLTELGISPDDILISNKLGWFRVPLTTDEPTFEPGAWADLAYDCVQTFGYDEIIKCFDQGNQLLGGTYRSELVSIHDPDEYLLAASDPFRSGTKDEGDPGVLQGPLRSEKRGESESSGNWLQGLDRNQEALCACAFRLGDVCQ